jgi:hypothetical protein
MTWVAAGTATLTAAEIAAAEAAMAAAATAAAEAAAAQAATAAATQAAAATTAEAALAPALTEVAATTLPEVAGSVLPEAATGILEAAPGAVPPPATPLPPAGLEQVGQAAVPPPPATPLPPAAPTPPAGIEQAGQGFTQAELNAINQGSADAMAAQGTGTQVAGPAQLVNAPGPSSTSMTQSELAEMASAETGKVPLVSEPVGTVPDTYSGPSDLISEPTTNPFMEGLKSVGEYIEKNPFKSGAAAYMGLQYLGAFDQKGGEVPQPRKFNNPYRLSPNFKGGPYSEPNVYKPRYASGGITSLQGGGGPVERMSMMNTAMNPQGGLYPQGMIDKTQYATPTQRPVSAEMVDEAPAYERSSPMLMASGGIARFANEGEVEERPRRYRGDLMGTLDKYNVMIEGRKSGSLPSGRADPYTGVVGTFEDNDRETSLQPADVAAMTRLKKEGKRANVGIAAIPMGVQAGVLKLPTNAAGGGIMQANLGSYAAGGNPRLLRGPGDGMSDNIPATIGGKQPARLADGEFVVPADVVSHLGNGSTDAGAKKLHAMMDKVRMDRTGKKKQAPAVKAKKYIPK